MTDKTTDWDAVWFALALTGGSAAIGLVVAAVALAMAGALNV